MESFKFLVSIVGFFTFCDGSPLANPRIIGGSTASLGYAPHMVALVSRVWLPDRPSVFRDQLVCGGSVVSRRHVLTAAHCLTPFVEGGVLAKSFFARIGSNEWQQGGIAVYFHTYHIHPQWDDKLIKYDAGILVLKEQLELSEKVAVIGLDFGWVDGGVSSYVTGWGQTGPTDDGMVVNLAPTPDHLQLLYVETVSHQQCEEGMHAAPLETPPVLPHVEICTFHSEGHGMCQGDSGSALVSVETGLQSGIVSWGYPCARGAPDVFTRVRGVQSFIEEVLASEVEEKWLNCKCCV